jgi:hypothetical protein
VAAKIIYLFLEDLKAGKGLTGSFGASRISRISFIYPDLFFGFN